MSSSGWIAASLFTVVSSTAFALEPVPVTTCGQVVMSGTLMTDLDCSESATLAHPVKIERTLYLNGHTLFVDAPPGVLDAVYCTSKRCKVVGPGAIDVRNHASAIRANAVSLENVSVTGGVLAAVKATGTNFADGQITSGGAGRMKFKQASFLRSYLSNSHNDDGRLHRSSVRIEDSTVVDSTIGGAQKLMLVNTTVSGNNEVPPLSSLARGRAIFDTERLLMAGSTVTLARGSGVEATRITITNSNVSANCQAPEPGDICADLVAARQPALSDSTCETSACGSPEGCRGIALGEPLGVCTAD